MPNELEAMQQLVGLLDGLTDDERKRVLVWAGSKYGATLGATKDSRAEQSGEPSPRPHEPSEHQEFADLYHAVNPQDNGGRALVAAYWLNLESENEPFQGQPANALLKDLGFQVSNITDAISQNMREKPALIVQTRKSGNSKQARKSYKITDAGKRRVRQWIESGA